MPEDQFTPRNLENRPEPKLRHSKYVRDYFIQKYSSGIYSLVFNTTERWLLYHRYTNTMYRIGGYPYDDNPDDDNEECTEEIAEGHLPEQGHYMKTSIQDKDQIIFYFIPFELIGIRDKDIIYSFSSK